MKQLTLIIGVGLILCGIPAAQSQGPTGTGGTRPLPTAGANLVDTQGRGLGQVHLQQTSHGVLVKLDLENTTPAFTACISMTSDDAIAPRSSQRAVTSIRRTDSMGS